MIWKGDVNPLPLTVSQDYDITANFERKEYELTTNVEGSAQENELEEKSKEYEHGTAVERVATPAEGYRFVEWTGDLEGSDNPAQVTVDTAKAVTAVFERKTFALDPDVQGEGSISKDPDQDEYKYGDKVTLIAEPADGWGFANWDGNVSSEENSTEVTIDKKKEVIAVFELNTFKLSVNLEGQGSVDRTPYKAKYDSGSVVMLTANPQSGYKFKEWKGEVSSTKPQVEISMDDDKEVSASFEPPFYLAKNGVTIVCDLAEMGASGTVNGVEYTKRTRDMITVDNAATTCTSGITDMSTLFSFEDEFNENIDSWDVSNVTDMSRMFEVVLDFNSNISSWDVSNVTNMNRMFSETRNFDSNISDWNVSSVTDMGRMFSGTSSFNRNISDWNVSSVTNMNNMFEGASDFLIDISDWCVSNITSKPKDFDTDAGFDDYESLQPNWGTCPDN